MSFHLARDARVGPPTGITRVAQRHASRFPGTASGGRVAPVPFFWLDGGENGGGSNGRVYTIHFTAEHEYGGTREGTVVVGHSPRHQ